MHTIFNNINNLASAIIIGELVYKRGLQLKRLERLVTNALKLKCYSKLAIQKLNHDVIERLVEPYNIELYNNQYSIKGE